MGISCVLCVCVGVCPVGWCGAVWGGDGRGAERQERREEEAERQRRKRGDRGGTEGGQEWGGEGRQRAQASETRGGRQREVSFRGQEVRNFCEIR